MATLIAIVQRVTLANGGWTWVKPGQRRGYVRVDIIDPSLRVADQVKTNHRAHVETVYQSGEGIFGVTERSHYSLRHAIEKATQIAHEWNMEQRA